MSSSPNRFSNEENFSDLIASYGETILTPPQVSDRIRGEIVSIGKVSVFIDTGSKIDGVVAKEELLDENGKMPYSQGERVELFIVAVHEGEIKLSEALSGIGGIQLLEDAHCNRIPVEGKVKETCKGGFSVEAMKRRAFYPVSQMDVKFVETPENYVGEILLFFIARTEDNSGNIFLSRRKLLEQVQQKARKNFSNSLTVGTVLTGTVIRLMPYGAFVELIPGVEGMVHISELSWSRIENPEEVVRSGDTGQIKVLRLEGDDPHDRKKIALSVKQLLIRTPVVGGKV